MENTYKTLRMGSEYPLEKWVVSLLKRVKTIIKIIQSKTKMKEIQTKVDQEHSYSCC